MSQILEQTEYGFEVELPHEFHADEKFYDLLPMGAVTDFCDTNFTCWGFESKSDAQETLAEVEAYIKDQGG